MMQNNIAKPYVLVVFILVLFNVVFSKLLVMLVNLGFDLDNPIFTLQVVLNKGAAFSLFNEHIHLLTAFSFIVAIGLGYYFFKTVKTNSSFENLAFSLLIAGVLGNFSERIFYGHVIDYFRLNFIDFPIFNFSDILITVATVSIIWITLANSRKNQNGNNENN